LLIRKGFAQTDKRRKEREGQINPHIRKNFSRRVLKRENSDSDEEKTRRPLIRLGRANGWNPKDEGME